MASITRDERIKRLRDMLDKAELRNRRAHEVWDGFIKDAIALRAHAIALNSLSIYASEMLDEFGPHPGDDLCVVAGDDPIRAYAYALYYAILALASDGIDVAAKANIEVEF